MADLRWTFDADYNAQGYGWVQIAQDDSRAYLSGFADGFAGARPTPRPALRLQDRRTDRVAKEWPARDEPAIGAVAGWPTSDQCVNAAIRALKQAPQAWRRRDQGAEIDARVAPALAILEGQARAAEWCWAAPPTTLQNMARLLADLDLDLLERALVVCCSTEHFAIRREGLREGLEANKETNGLRPEAGPWPGWWPAAGKGETNGDR